MKNKSYLIAFIVSLISVIIIATSIYFNIPSEKEKIAVDILKESKLTVKDETSLKIY